MRVNFLAAKLPLVKHFQRVLNEIQTLPYPLVSKFISTEVEINSLSEFYAALQVHSAKGRCLLKGVLDKPLINESRAGHTEPLDPTWYILIDIDGLNGYTPDSLMQEIGLGDVSYIVQYSASSGVKPEKGLSCHIFILLEGPANPVMLKSWLMGINLQHFKSQITLNRLNESLHWPIDITTCQNDKLIYIAPPICDPPEIDTFNQPRIQLIQRPNQTFNFPNSFNPAHQTALDILKDELRKAKGLPKAVREKLDAKSSVIYSPHPKAAAVTGVRTGEEFTHLNLNGGDSWGYYHLTKEPHFVYNFKGEPTYKIKELLPNYWITLKKAQNVAKKQIIGASRTLLAMRDFATDIYYNGWYDPQTDTLILAQAGSKAKLIDFLSQHGAFIPETIPDWTTHYDPCDSKRGRADVATRTINWFEPSEYMRLAITIPSIAQDLAPPPNILYLIRNVIGSDPQLVEHFLNWCACAYRHRLPNGTAWILQGVPGTGKGMLINEVLRPLFGASNVSIKRMSELSDKFNEYIENTLLCHIDEIAIGEDRNHDKIMADLKQQITEPTITIRKMRTAAREIRNHTNWIFSTNNKQPIRIEEGDRRYNVGDFCVVMLEKQVDTYEFAAKIKDELPAFHQYLSNRSADKRVAATVIHNEARKSMIESAMVTADVVSKAIRSGDLATLYDWIDDSQDIVDNVRFVNARTYSDLILELIMTRRDYLKRSEIHTIFAATVGKIPRESAKFTQYLKYHEIELKPVKRDHKVFRGLLVDWVVDEEWLKAVQKELSLGKVVPLIKVQKDQKDEQA